MKSDCKSDASIKSIINFAKFCEGHKLLAKSLKVISLPKIDALNSSKITSFLQNRGDIKSRYREGGSSFKFEQKMGGNFDLNTRAKHALFGRSMNKDLGQWNSA